MDVVRRGLEPLLADEASLERAIRGVKAIMEHIPDLAARAPESGLFDFQSRVEPVLQRFSRHGLTRDDYLKAAIRHPQLFCLNPETVTSNIERVVAHFVPDDLAPKAYLQAAVKQPSLFYQRPETIIANVEGVLEHFAADGLTRSDYLRAAIKQPSVFTHTSETIIANVEGVLEHFAADGLTRSDYLRAAIKQPSLLCQRPETIICHIERVAAHFAPSGLTRGDYLKAAIKQPSLFSQNAETIIGHVNLVEELHRKGLLPLPNSTRGPPSKMSPVLAFMVNEPSLLTLADDNFALREIAAHVTETPPTTALLRRTRSEVEHELSKALGHDDLNEAIPKIDASAGQDHHARNLLLRALIREGMVKGRLA
jgi:hypothetical protein